MFVLMYDPKGIVRGSQEIEPFNVPVQTTNLIACDPQVAANYAGYSVDLSGPVPTLVFDPVQFLADMSVALTAQVQSLMDNSAKQYGYDSIQTAVTYADEPAVPKFQLEGRAFREWRSLVWAAAYALFADVQSGAKPFPSPEDIPGLLPPFVAPPSTTS